MRGIIWLLVLFAAAVVAATALGQNDGLVTVAWGGWRVEASLNLSLLLLVAFCGLMVLVLRALESFLSLPQRAGEWRAAQRERAAHAALREGFSAYFGGRYSRAHKAAQRALSLHEDHPELQLPADHGILSLLVAAGSLHRLQDRDGRDALIQRLSAKQVGAGGQAAVEGGLLLAAEWALDDRDGDRAETLLKALPAGVARRTLALRLRLRAARLAQQTLQALEMTRLLAKHQAFSPLAAAGLLRALGLEHLDAARDADQLRRQWRSLEDTDRRDPVVLAHAVRKAVAWQAAADARQWLADVWPELPRASAEDRTQLALALAAAAEGAEAEWLERVETAARTWPADPAVALAAGEVALQHQLYGKARQWLQRAAAHPALLPSSRRKAWRHLSHLAQEAGDTEQAARCDAQAAALEDAA
jgi:HemY protein